MDYSKHLEIIFGTFFFISKGNTSINWINKYAVLGVVMFINFFITLAAIPSIVKFGNWYSKTLKEVYYDEDD